VKILATPVHVANWRNLRLCSEGRHTHDPSSCRFDGPKLMAPAT